MRIAVCGGVYSNPWALRAFIEDAHRNNADRVYCLGDLGGYGAAPEPVWPLLTENDVICVAGNYDVAIASGADDCGCGYPDPRDQEYAQVMYDYTLRNTSRPFADWMGTLPTERREQIGGCDVHFVHGSTVGLNDFWWESLPEGEHRRRVDGSGADVILCTHSGLPWQRRVGDSLVVNVGVIGRPANDGDRRVRYALLDFEDGQVSAQIVRLHYDWRTHADELDKAGLPEAFARTSRTGWWTTCLEVLPNHERARGRFHIYDSSVQVLLQALGLPDGAWPDPDPSIPVRSLWGSPLLPDHIWYQTSPIETAELAEAAAQAELAQVRAVVEPPPLRRIGGSGSVVPELTLTRAGWFWHPRLMDEEPMLRHPPELPHTGAFMREARIATVRRLLNELQKQGLLTPPRYCAV
ncbi:metallophosphoesterase family protein [Sphaerisporangium sp. NPDC005289]|uniref:metallophosphoesterase family protein n=1 Tax=Sphaerisporangium sp. NPDC005289 TaxID=3155247 RepID=UPI0033B7DB31